MKVRALSCSIYTDKNIGDCSNNGISSRFRDVYVFCPDGNVEIDLDNMPENFVNLEIRHFSFGTFKRFISCSNNGRWCSFGGAFVWSCDSRFREHFSEYPIPLHDRYE